MSSSLKKRIKKLNNAKPINGKSVVYVMSRDQRVKDNHALIAAQAHAQSLNLPLIVCFNVYPKIKNRAKNQYVWMFEGLKKIEIDLKKKNIPFVLEVGNAVKAYKHWEKDFKPVAIYFDFSPLRGPKKVKKDFADKSSTPCYVVDTHNIIPVWEASDKNETAARTIRPKLFEKLEQYFIEPEKISKQKVDSKFKISNPSWAEVIKKIKAEELANYKPIVESGEDEAKKVLNHFIKEKLKDYPTNRNEPVKDGQSNLSAYLHFGQISSLRVLLEIVKLKDINPDQITEHKLSKALVNELFVWKELSDNFCYYEKDYDNIHGASEWAIKSLDKHRKDERDSVYTLDELEKLRTHDNAWNAAQSQLMKTGKMHGYMRMYWAKKLLEWSTEPEIAIDNAIYLNDKYELDGYDPNGFAGIMWGIAGVHDHGWTERDIFGKIRYMNFEGLKRKFEIDAYIEKYLKN
ncbi:deoxyribodipyrimidine photo-lyase [Candidatus Dojkabacteria bacterium]|uniref:Deoxyribodipyrimidine photo-lyase n=1 Tax=Candidatus Dojkabacteria bacterium TaxID=2099670 RepID=A0A955LAY1_9BACT|nr:deoxyribodipyrimidine photo-lyase [Candidatus Dojkabacteria bacterium]